MEKGALSHFAMTGAEIAVRVTPRARRPGVTVDGDTIRVAVTAPPEDGRANAAVTEALAHALGIAKGRLVLLRGAASRDKVFRVSE